MFNKRFVVPFEGRFSLILKSFSDREKQIFFGAMGILVGTTIVLVMAVNRAFIVEIPANGGTLTEGVLNTPAHINPLLATGEIGSEADRDLVALIYSGLLRATSDGNYIPDLAEHYDVSSDGITYTFKLRDGLTWHDGKKITADDVVFTIKTAQDGRIKSPKRASWDGVGVEKIEDGTDLTVRFTLTKPYPSFLENTTMGILPKHIWNEVEFNRFDTNKHNREPIGSGPYKLDSIETVTKAGDTIPVAYKLKAFNDFALGRPHIDAINVLFYHSEESLVQALKSGEVDAINSIAPARAQELSKDGYRIVHTPLPRVLAVFFNQNDAAVFADPSVRKALSLATDKQEIVNKALAGYGVILDSATPPGTLGYVDAKEESSRALRIEKARATLEKGGWSYASSTNSWTKKVKKETITLSFSLATSDAEELKAVAQELKEAWGELGIQTEVKIFAIGDLKETIVRPRKFDALFFGQVLGRDGDPYPFWHSSQRMDPGLNIASYANSRVDKYLTDARGETSTAKRNKIYQAFNEEIMKDLPAIFIYAPEFLYVIPEKTRGLVLGSITMPAERFLNVHEWYINTDGVWRIFARP